MFTTPTIIKSEPIILPLVILHPFDKGHFLCSSIALTNCVKYRHISANIRLYMIRNIDQIENIL